MFRFEPLQSKPIKLGIVVVCRNDVQPDKLFMNIKDRLKFDSLLFHAENRPHFSLVLTKFNLVTCSSVLSNFLCYSVLKFNHVPLEHLLVRFAQGRSSLHILANPSKAK